MREILWSEDQSGRAWGSVFEVVVDGEIKDSIMLGGSIEVSLPRFARYVEIRDAESKMMVANCHLMDPQDLPDTGWKSSVKFPTGGRLNFHFTRDMQGSEMAGLSMKIGINAKRAWSATIRNWADQALQPSARSKRASSLAWATCVAALAVALSMSLIAIYNLKGQVNSLQKENSDLQMQISEIPALKNEVAELRQSRIQPASSPPQEALYDGSNLVAMDSQGNLAGLETISQEFQQMIRTALMTGQVQAPDLRSLVGRTPTLMGGNVESETFTLISPVSVVIETTRPIFRWNKLRGATSYTVIVTDSDYNEIEVSKSVSGTQWSLSRPLERGKIYLWLVIALKDGKEIKSPNMPGITAKFQVLNQAKADELTQAKKSHTDSHLVIGLLYARAGLLDEAERELKHLLAANPKSSAAQNLLRSVQVLRRAW
jgi:hypothetical protein